MPTLDVFSADAFSTISLSQALMTLPFKATRIKELGIFAPKGVRTRSIMVEEKAGQLALLEDKPWGAPPLAQKPEKRTVRSFAVPHFPLADAVMAEDVQDIRAFGSETEIEVVSKKVNEKLATMKQTHEITQEYLMMGALRGTIVDGAGTELFNLFTEFSVTELTTDLLLGTALTVPTKFAAIKRQVEGVIGALPMDHIHILCGATLFDNIVRNSKVRDAYARWQNGAFLRKDNRAGFELFGTIIEEYRGAVGSTQFLPLTEARAFPVGAPGLFQMHYSPADYMETVNTMGQAFYAKQERIPFDKGITIETQSNALPMCMLPAACVKITTSTDSS